jgi:hypothetical protein
MNKFNDDNCRPKLGPPKARGQACIPFVSRVVKASAKAGHPIGHRFRSPSARPGAKLGRGQVAARVAGQHLGQRARRVVIKTRLVVAKRATPRATQRHLRYVQRDGITRERCIKLLTESPVALRLGCEVLPDSRVRLYRPVCVGSGGPLSFHKSLIELR